MYRTKCCPENHILIWTSNRTPCYSDNNYVCDKCGIVLHCSLRRWWCEKCTYDLCPSCLPHHNKPQTQTCNEGHDLIWTTEPYSGGHGYRCDCCGIALPGKSGRWCCYDCQYDLCAYCSESLKCNKGHTLNWSITVPRKYIGEYYRCDS